MRTQSARTAARGRRVLAPLAGSVMLRKFLARGLLAALLVFVALQLVPYGRAHENPPVRGEPAWDSSETRALAQRACFDCHSNETQWPWYSNVAPVSWLVQYDVDEGRAKLNFSTWNVTQGEGDEAASALKEGEMPPYAYVAMHGHARLTPQETAQLAQGFAKTLGGGEGKGERLSQEADEDDERGEGR